MSKTISRGYVLLTGCDHPLAIGGIVGEHRVVLYEKIGPGTHSCNWCGTPVTWMVGKIADVHKRGKKLCADHVDRNTQNNAPENLVPACGACNTTRSSDHRVAKRVLRRELWRKEENGSFFLLTLECGHQVVRRSQSSQRAWCAACVGREEPTPPEKRTGLGDAVRRAVVPPGGYDMPTAVGPMRHVVRELGYRPRDAGSGYLYMYRLACGHEVERATPNKTICACNMCPKSSTGTKLKPTPRAPRAVVRTVVPHHPKAVAMALALRARGDRPRKIAYALNEAGMRTRTGKPFTSDTVEAMLASR